MKNIIKKIIREELLFESLEDRLKSAYQKWCKKTKSKRQQTIDNIYDADGYVEELDVYSSDFSDPYSKMYQKAEELYAKEDYEGLLKMIADHQCSGVYIDREFKEWLSYRNLMKSSDIFQYKSENELYIELQKAKEKSFTKKLKKASAGEDFDKIWENDDMLIVVPKSHVGACKFGQGTKWCTASKNNNYFDSYYKSGILYRILQKNGNYKKLLSDFAYIRDIDNLSKVSVNLNRKNGSMTMVDKTDNYYKHERTEEFLNYLPSEGYKAIKNYQSLNEQNLNKIIKEEINDFGWIDENPIEVGKCVTLKSNSHGDVLVKISKIQTPKDTDKLNDLAILNRTRVYFDMFHTGYLAMSLKYSEVENYINSDVIIPCDCPTVKESKNKLIKESGVENYLQSIASITSGNQKIYYDWLLSNLEKVSVVSYRSNEELKEKVDRFVKKMRRFGDFCEKKGCFDTAYNTAMYVPGVHYIEGYVQSMIPLVHAWNYLPEEGIYFDLINDIAWKEEDSHFNEYYKVIDLDKSGVLKWSSKTGYGGGFIESPQFIEEVIKKSVK